METWKGPVMSQRDSAGPSPAKAMATSETEVKGKRPAAPPPPDTMPPTKRANTGDGVSQAPQKGSASAQKIKCGGGRSPFSGVKFSRFQAVEKCIPSIKEQVSASTDVQWFANSLVEKELIGAQPKNSILQTVDAPDTDKVGQLMRSVVVQIKNNPAKYSRFLGVLRQQPVLASLAESIKTMEKVLRTQPTEVRTTQQPSTGTPESGTSLAPKPATDNPRTKGKKCGECSGCLAKSSCGECTNCKDKKKYGGPGTGNYRKKCIQRQCKMLTTGGYQPHTPTANHNQAQVGTDCPQLKPMPSTTLLNGVGPTTTPQPIALVQGTMLAATQPQPPEHLAPPAKVSPKEKRRPELTTSSAITPAVVPQAKSVTQVEKEQTDNLETSICSECSTWKATVTKLEEELKQKDKQLQTVVSYCEGKQTQFKQIQRELQTTREQIQQWDKDIAAFQQQWKEIQDENGLVAANTQ